jgi:hypothetical protein
MYPNSSIQMPPALKENTKKCEIPATAHIIRFDKQILINGRLSLS